MLLLGRYSNASPSLSSSHLAFKVHDSTTRQSLEARRGWTHTTPKPQTCFDILVQKGVQLEDPLHAQNVELGQKEHALVAKGKARSIHWYLLISQSSQALCWRHQTIFVTLRPIFTPHERAHAGTGRGRKQRDRIEKRHGTERKKCFQALTLGSQEKVRGHEEKQRHE